MAYKTSNGRSIGIPDLNAVYTTLGVPGVSNLPSVTTEAQPGEIVTAWDNTLGYAEFILLKVPASTTVTAGLLYRYKGSDYSIVVVPTAVSSAALSGSPIALATNTVASSTSVQYTWFQVAGKGTALKSGSISMQPDVALFVSNVTAGRVRSTASIFRAILGMRSANSATVSTVVSTVLVVMDRPSIGPGA